MNTLDWDHLRQRLCRPLADLTPFEASGLALRLGGLARWCLRPEVLTLAAEDDAIPEAYRIAWRGTPRLSPGHGSCWVIFATDRQEAQSLLRPAFVLPLQWVEGETPSTLLPPELVNLAANVVTAFGNVPRIAGGRWHLKLSPELGAMDLSRMPLQCQSGWAPLAAGLLVAAEGGKPDPQVWATGSWDDRSGVQRVDHLSEKLALRAEFGAREFFVPSAQEEESRKLAPGLDIRSLQMATREPRAALADYVLRLEAPPPQPADADDEQGFERCVTYYMKRRQRGQSRTTEFYWSHLLPTVTQRCCAQARNDWPDWQPTHLLTIVSGSPELVPLAVRALGVRNCLLLFTPHTAPRLDQTAAMESVRAVLKPDGVECIPGRFADSETLTREIPARIEQFVAGVSPNAVVLDITPGNKWMTWVADQAMPAGSWRLYVRNDTLTPADHRPRPGSERLVCWRV